MKFSQIQSNGKVMSALAGMVDSGVDAKFVIQEGQVLVNGEVDTRRGRKLFNGDVIRFDEKEAKIESSFVS